MWLTGQMPQIRAIRDGISWTIRPWLIRSKPRNWVTWKWASATSPDSSSWMVILACPSIRVTGSMTIVLSAKAGHPRGNGHPPGDQIVEDAVDQVGRGRASRHEDIDLDHGVHRT